MNLYIFLFCLLVLNVIRYFYVESPLHYKLYNISEYSTYMLIIFFLSLVYCFKSCNNVTFIAAILMVIIGRMIYRKIVGSEITDQSLHPYNNIICNIGLLTFLWIIMK